MPLDFVQTLVLLENWVAWKNTSGLCIPSIWSYNLQVIFIENFVADILLVIGRIPCQESMGVKIRYMIKNQNRIKWFDIYGYKLQNLKKKLVRRKLAVKSMYRKPVEKAGLAEWRNPCYISKLGCNMLCTWSNRFSSFWELDPVWIDIECMVE